MTSPCACMLQAPVDPAATVSAELAAFFASICLDTPGEQAPVLAALKTLGVKKPADFAALEADDVATVAAAMPKVQAKRFSAELKRMQASGGGDGDNCSC